MPSFFIRYQKVRQRTQRGKSYEDYSYEVGERRWINNAYSKSQKSDQLSAKRFGPFFVKKLGGKNALNAELPRHFKIHIVVNVVHTAPYHEQLSNILAPVKKDRIQFLQLEASNISLSQS